MEDQQLTGRLLSRRHLKSGTDGGDGRTSSRSTAGMDTGCKLTSSPVREGAGAYRLRFEQWLHCTFTLPHTCLDVCARDTEREAKENTKSVWVLTLGTFLKEHLCCWLQSTSPSKRCRMVGGCIWRPAKPTGLTFLGQIHGSSQRQTRHSGNTPTTALRMHVHCGDSFPSLNKNKPNGPPLLPPPRLFLPSYPIMFHVGPNKHPNRGGERTAFRMWPVTESQSVRVSIPSMRQGELKPVCFHITHTIRWFEIWQPRVPTRNLNISCTSDKNFS